MSAISSLGPADFTTSMQNLLGPGALFSRDPDALLTTLLGALSNPMADAHTQAGVLSEMESNPQTTVDLLPDWEKSFGLPDPCTPLTPTIAQRQAALVERISGRGGQSPEYFISVAAALGYTITIQTFTPWRFGQSTFGQPLANAQWQFVWQVNVTADTLGSGTQIGCVLNRRKPAHTVLIMNYEVG